MLSSCVCCWCSWLLQCRRTVRCLFMYCISFSFVLSLSFSNLVWLSRSSLLMDWSVWRRSMTWPMVSNSNVIKKGNKREEKCNITIQNFRYWNSQNVYNVHFWEPSRYFCAQLSKSSHLYLFEQTISALYPVSSSDNCKLLKYVKSQSPGKWGMQVSTVQLPFRTFLWLSPGTLGSIWLFWHDPPDSLFVPAACRSLSVASESPVLSVWFEPAPLQLSLRHATVWHHFP